MSPRTVLAVLACALASLAIGVSAAPAASVSLLVSQSTAFSYLGHSCGGIKEQASATGFDPASSFPTGEVYLSTRCGGSGRGGGYHVTTYSAWIGVTWDFAGNVLSSVRLTTGVPVNPTYTDANLDTLSNSAGRAYLTVPAPGSPAIVLAVQATDQFQVSWAPVPQIPAVITSSTLTATPVGSIAPTVTTTVTGSATTGLVGPLQPATTYQITVVSTTIGGSSAPSNAVTVTTAAASIAPSAPTGVNAHWTAPGSPNDTLVASWTAAAPGDSPTDGYEVTINNSDGGSTLSQTLGGSTLSATFAVSDDPDWSVSVRAHNAAGWGPWSAAFTLGGA
jgi:Fibronectin type III domain